ncbi:hypothetical protein [Hymenobacter edaphi]|uniref:hypothetical protein n=1 Tax=Hymenobacter edaphi TaxID=2211146 RepID=UPI001057AC9F|nr:hypothetical protein [Hymenobacter edaphi]
MSQVTNLIITLAAGEDIDRAVTGLHKFEHHGYPFVIKSVDDDALPRGWYGGSKYLEANLLIGAYNNLDLRRLINHMRNMHWDSPEDVQVIFKEPHDFKFKLRDVFPELEE